MRTVPSSALTLKAAANNLHLALIFDNRRFFTARSAPSVWYGRQETNCQYYENETPETDVKENAAIFVKALIHPF